jgi:hypothetical protein
MEAIEWGGYAKTIILNPADYDGLEVHGVRDCADEFGITDGTACEVDDDGNPEFYSVYAHLREGGLECIGDFATGVDAVAYGALIAGEHSWPLDIHAKGICTDCGESIEGGSQCAGCRSAEGVRS